MFSNVFYYKSGVVRPTDQETTALEKRVCNTQFHTRGGPSAQGPHRAAPRISWEGEGVGKNVSKAFVVVSVGRNG